jgi:hypothetical protein
MNTELYLDITNPDTCEKGLRGIYQGDGWHFATNGFIGAFALGDTDLPEAPNHKILDAGTSLLLTLKEPILKMLFNPDFLRMALKAFEDNSPVTVSIFWMEKAGGHLVQFENEHGRSVAMSMRMTDDPPKWMASK